MGAGGGAGRWALGGGCGRDEGRFDGGGGAPGEGVALGLGFGFAFGLGALGSLGTLGALGGLGAFAGLEALPLRFFPSSGSGAGGNRVGEGG